MENVFFLFLEIFGEKRGKLWEKVWKMKKNDGKNNWKMKKNDLKNNGKNDNKNDGKKLC
ncbi:hypothetical protein RFI_05252 [Reticulomyxa filosa]|uniref:Uncharacterized protein n=1 Tax=Reticulomyxa filosa TaxID=46433 RepID=X6NZZ3_RETFI|nr:hypothetical protein RFI_05252 [Reticulomyxa filosa]|eukprot:ETO31865.1 hypothetical protein RFI_05252 [Reticulomyxa filosa]